MGAIATSQRQPDPRYGCTIVAVLAATETVSWGILYYAFAVFLAPMRRDLGWSKAELTGAFAVALATSALAAFPVGRWLDRHSPRPLMTLGSLVGALLVLAWSQVHDLLLFYLIWIGIGLAMACVLYEAAFTVVTKWFRERRRGALTAVTLVGGLASFVFSPLSNWLIDTQGWRDALITLALILAVATVPLHGLFLRPAPKHEGREAPALVPGDPPAPPSERQFVADAAVGSSAFWYLTAAFVLSSFAISAIAVHLIPYLLEGGRSASFAAAAAGLLGLMQIPGRLVFAGAARALPRGPLHHEQANVRTYLGPVSSPSRHWRCGPVSRPAPAGRDVAISPHGPTSADDLIAERLAQFLARACNKKEREEERDRMRPGDFRANWLGESTVAQASESASGSWNWGSGAPDRPLG